MIARFSFEGRTYIGTVHGEKITSEGRDYDLGQIKLLAPSEPSKIVCVGLNYVKHARELNMTLPDEPILFLKPPSAVLNPEDEIVSPPSSQQVDYEGELGVVLGKKCKGVKASEAENYILGYTCFNDVTARDLQRKDGQWTRAKSFDTFAPFGPWISVDIDPDDLDIKTRVNGRTVQDSNTSDLIFNVRKLIEFISGVMTLLPGDVIATGTPPGVGKLEMGDIVEVEVEGIGVLKNSVAL